MNEKCLMIYTIKNDQFKKQSAEEVEKLNRDKKDRNQKRKVHISLLQK